MKHAEDKHWEGVNQQEKALFSFLFRINLCGSELLWLNDE